MKLTDRTTQLILSSAVRESCLIRDDRDRSLTPQCTTPTTTRPLGRLSSPRGPCESHRTRPRPELTYRILLLGLIGSFAQHYFHHIDVSYSCYDCPPVRC